MCDQRKDLVSVRTCTIPSPRQQSNQFACSDIPCFVPSLVSANVWWMSSAHLGKWYHYRLLFCGGMGFTIVCLLHFRSLELFHKKKGKNEVCIEACYFTRLVCCVFILDTYQETYVCANIFKEVSPQLELLLSWTSLPCKLSFLTYSIVKTSSTAIASKQQEQSSVSMYFTHCLKSEVMLFNQSL